ncbi:MAG: hypothetical protein ACPGLV_11815 [Bacteroidia bacterium]
MKNINLIIIALVFGVLACKTAPPEPFNHKTQTIKSNQKVDHLNIWVKDPIKAKQMLIDLGFTAVPDSMCQIHNGQGTTGRYFHFLNAYLELIFIYDRAEFDKNNEVNQKLDFAERASFQSNGALPISIALKMNEYDVAKIPFEKNEYHQDWMQENMNIYAAKSSKTNLNEPSVFVVYPELESDTFATLDDLTNIPDEYAFAREYFKHSNGVKKITKIKITSPGLDLSSETMKAVSDIDKVIVADGNEQLLELTFDKAVQGKNFDLRPDLLLVLHL